MGTVFLKPKREKSIYRRHPWIFSGAIERTDTIEENGQTVNIISSSGKPLGTGSWSAQSQIQVRIWSYDPDEQIDVDFFRKLIERAAQSRKLLQIAEQTNAYRIVNSEADGLPGLIVDRYADYLVCQFLSAGAEYWKSKIVNLLQQLVEPIGIYERSDVNVRKKEGLEEVSGVLFGEEPPDLLEIHERDLKFYVDLKGGHKTGFYLDQRENRIALTEFCDGMDVLNCFAYSGSFGIYALHAGADSVIHIESSAPALELARKNTELNRIDQQHIEYSTTDVFQTLRTFRDSRRSFDVVILDPPKFAESGSQVQKASRAYKDINLLAIKLLNPGGVLVTFSQSGHVTPELFQKIIADAAVDAGKDVQVVRYLTQAADHPVALNFPESYYLKGLICRVW